MAVRSTNTYQEGLQSLVQDVASLLLLPDANPDFLFRLQNDLIAEATTAAQPQNPMAMQQQAGNAMPLAELAGQANGAPMAMPGGGPLPGSGPVPTTPAADELRRMLQ